MQNKINNKEYKKIWLKAYNLGSLLSFNSNRLYHIIDIKSRSDYKFMSPNFADVKLEIEAKKQENKQQKRKTRQTKEVELLK